VRFCDRARRSGVRKCRGAEPEVRAPFAREGQGCCEGSPHKSVVVGPLLSRQWVRALRTHTVRTTLASLDA
jgi:hypothetical protein